MSVDDSYSEDFDDFEDDERNLSSSRSSVADAQAARRGDTSRVQVRGSMTGGDDGNGDNEDGSAVGSGVQGQDVGSMQRSASSAASLLQTSIAYTEDFEDEEDEYEDDYEDDYEDEEEEDLASQQPVSRRGTAGVMPAAVPGGRVPPTSAPGVVRAVSTSAVIQQPRAQRPGVYAVNPQTQQELETLRHENEQTRQKLMRAESQLTSAQQETNTANALVRRLEADLDRARRDHRQQLDQATNAKYEELQQLRQEAAASKAIVTRLEAQTRTMRLEHRQEMDEASAARDLEVQRLQQEAAAAEAVSKQMETELRVVRRDSEQQIDQANRKLEQLQAAARDAEERMAKERELVPSFLERERNALTQDRDALDQEKSQWAREMEVQRSQAAAENARLVAEAERLRREEARIAKERTDLEQRAVLLGPHLRALDEEKERVEARGEEVASRERQLEETMHTFHEQRSAFSRERLTVAEQATDAREGLRKLAADKQRLEHAWADLMTQRQDLWHAKSDFHIQSKALNVQILKLRRAITSIRRLSAYLPPSALIACQTATREAADAVAAWDTGDITLLEPAPLELDWASGQRLDELIAPPAAATHGGAADFIDDAEQQQQHQPRTAERRVQRVEELENVQQEGSNGSSSSSSSSNAHRVVPAGADPGLDSEGAAAQPSAASLPPPPPPPSSTQIQVRQGEHHSGPLTQLQNQNLVPDNFSSPMTTGGPEAPPHKSRTSGSGNIRGYTHNLDDFGFESLRMRAELFRPS